MVVPAAFAQAAPAGSAALPERPWRIAHIPLGMPAEGELDGQYLEGIYQEQLAPLLKSSHGRADAPVYTIHTELAPAAGADEPGLRRTLDIWFSSLESGRRAFWIAGFEPQPDGTPAQAVMAQLHRRFGEPSRDAHVAVGNGHYRVLVFVAPDTDTARRRATVDALPEPLMAPGMHAFEVLRQDLRHKAAWLGTGFRGALVMFHADPGGRVAAVNMELIDMSLAASVLRLEP